MDKISRLILEIQEALETQISAIKPQIRDILISILQKVDPSDIEIIVSSSKVSGCLNSLESRYRSSKERAISTGLDYWISILRDNKDEVMDLVRIADDFWIYFVRKNQGGPKILGLINNIKHATKNA